MRSLQGLLHFYLRWQTIQRKHRHKYEELLFLSIGQFPRIWTFHPPPPRKKKPREVESQSKNCDNKGGKKFV